MIIFIIFILAVAFFGRLFTRPFGGYYRPFGGFGRWGMGYGWGPMCGHHHHHHHHHIGHHHMGHGRRW